MPMRLLHITAALFSFACVCLALPALAAARETVTLPGSDPEYWALTAELARGADVLARGQGAVVVERPRNFGQDDPQSFFAIQQSTGGARTERLGVKWVRAGRDWRWAEMRRGSCWLPDLSEVRANHQLIMCTMTAYRPPWAEELAAGNYFWVGEGAGERIAWWAAFVEHSARELAPMVDTFEIQNEPDLTCMWQVGLDFAKGTERYARILESAAGAETACLIGRIEALREHPSPLVSPALECAGRQVVFAVPVQPEDYLETDWSGRCRHFDRNGGVIAEARPQGELQLAPGDNGVRLTSQAGPDASTRAEVTLCVRGEPLAN